jgi:formylglycine-generating enzyme required for sulfatase activity
MHGNMFEWCWDAAPLAGASHRAYRSGSASYTFDNCRAAKRNSNDLYRRTPYYGFRVMFYP